MEKTRDKLINKNRDEIAALKARSVLNSSVTGVFSSSGFEIDIISVNGIKDGVEVFARVKKEGVPVGFGKDGSVEIERFKIINPPLLVDDPNGDIEIVVNDDSKKQKTKRVLREDPKEALRQTISHTLSVMKNIHVGSKNIIQGKVGKTTSTFYPSMDGIVQNFNQNSGISWSTMVNDSVGTSVDYTSSSNYLQNYLRTGGIFNRNVFRAFYLFDTSSIGGDSISSATYSFYITAKNTTATNPSSNYYSVVSSNPASNTELVVGDYDSLGSTHFSSDVTVDSMSTNSYIDFALNGSGIAAIATGSTTKFGVREGHDLDNQTPGEDGGDGTYVLTYMSEQSGTSNDPKLVVEHAAAASSGMFFAFA